jgi:uncharacterized protein YhfF
MTSRADRFWNEFLKNTGRDPDLKYFEAFCFGSSPASADSLLKLVLSGKKQATSSSVLYYEAINRRMPEPGDLSIVTDWAGTPFCVIETTATEVVPFSKIDFDMCKREGEDDTLDSWRENHVDFFTTDGKKEGYEFSADMLVVFEDFKIVYR